MWTGHRYDAPVGLYHFLFRSYSPTLGRWMQRDPLGYVDGTNPYASASGVASAQASALRAQLEVIYQARVAVLAAAAPGKVIDDLVKETRKSGKERSDDLPK